MIVVESINNIYITVVNLINNIKLWFNNINFAELIEFLPYPYPAVVGAVVVIIISLAAIGLIKKMSLLLG